MSLEFTEYCFARPVYGALPDMPPGQELATQSVEVGAASAQSAAFGGRTQQIVVSNVAEDCRIAIGPDPTADNDGGTPTRFLNAGGEYRFAVQPGHKLAVIQAAAA